MAAIFVVFVDDILLTYTLNWLPKHPKRPYKSCYIANPTSCSTLSCDYTFDVLPNYDQNHCLQY